MRRRFEVLESHQLFCDFQIEIIDVSSIAVIGCENNLGQLSNYRIAFQFTKHNKYNNLRTKTYASIFKNYKLHCDLKNMKQKCLAFSILFLIVYLYSRQILT